MSEFMGILKDKMAIKLFNTYPSLRCTLTYCSCSLKEVLIYFLGAFYSLNERLGRLQAFSR